MNLDLTNFYYNKVLGKRNNFPYSRNSKIYEKETRYTTKPQYSEQMYKFPSVLGLQYFEVPLYMFICLCFFYVLGIQLMKTEQ